MPPGPEARYGVHFLSSGPDGIPPLSPLAPTLGRTEPVSTCASSMSSAFGKKCCYLLLVSALHAWARFQNFSFTWHVCHESHAGSIAKFVGHDFGYKNSVATRVAGQKVEFTQWQAQSKTCRALRFLFIKAYAYSREYSPTQPVGRHPARPNPPLNGRSNGVPPSLGHSRLFAHFLWPRLGVTPLASPLAIR
jgi:hypothetical protein